jgi:ribonuclease III
MMDEVTVELEAFEGILDVKFQNPELLKRALTHRSFVNEVEADLNDNERLEFLGDAILDFIVADMLFRRFPDVSEGELTQLRAALVRTDSLAILAANCQLGNYLLIGKGEENSGGRTRTNNLCRGFEALIGAMYMDGGLQVVKDFVLPRLKTLLAYILEHDLHKDARSILQERSQAELRFTPVYRLVDAAGPDHEKEFLVEVLVGDVVIGEGIGTSKRTAAQTAARNALKEIEENGWSDEARKVLEAQLAAEQAALDDSDTADETPKKALVKKPKGNKNPSRFEPRKFKQRRDRNKPK